MKRSQLVSMIRTAGYHGDRAAFVRLYTSGRISFNTAQRAYDEGKKARAGGVLCTCKECRANKPA